jgi:hypothetical protein
LGASSPWRQDLLWRWPPEQNRRSRALLPDDTVDQAIDAIAGHFNAGSLFEGDGLERSNQRSLIDVRTMLPDVGAGGLQQMLANMRLSSEAPSQRIAELVEPFGWPERAASLAQFSGGGSGRTSGIVTLSSSPRRTPLRRGIGLCSPGPKLGRAT